jgi:hypothetical protein
VRGSAAVVFILVSLTIPFAGAAGPDNARLAGPFVASPELTVTGADIVNHTIPARYGISPTPIDIRVGISDTALPGPKGEMAAGPRTIGFTIDPLPLAILIVTIIAGAAGVWYLVKKRPEEEAEEEGEEDGDDERGGWTAPVFPGPEPDTIPKIAFLPLRRAWQKRRCKTASTHVRVSMRDARSLMGKKQSGFLIPAKWERKWTGMPPGKGITDVDLSGGWLEGIWKYLINQQ